MDYSPHYIFSISCGGAESKGLRTPTSGGRRIFWPFLPRSCRITFLIGPVTATGYLSVSRSATSGLQEHNASVISNPILDNLMLERVIIRTHFVNISAMRFHQKGRWQGPADCRRRPLRGGSMRVCRLPPLLHALSYPGAVSQIIHPHTLILTK